MKFEKRVYNFSAGPSMLPEKVIEKIGAEILNYESCGQSVMEMSHRSAEFEGIILDAESNLRKLMNIGDDYKILFLQGGATLQFSMIPMNLLKKSKKADYVVTGAWAKKAAQECAKYGDVKIAADSSDKMHTYIPSLGRKDFREDADYVHITYNNTIYGSKYEDAPDTGGIPLVADMSSCILSERVDISKFGLIYAGAQKNIAPAGMCVVIIREDLLGENPESIPTYMDYNIHVKNNSMYNTPPCFTIYAAGEVFKYIIDMGGIEKIEEINRRKSAKLYNYIDSSELYKAPVEIPYRSLMNAVFVTGDENLDKKFVKEAKEKGMLNLNGHRSIGGMRASIYNAMPEAGVDALIAFMKEFEAGV